MQHSKHNEQWPNNRRNVYAAFIPWHIFRIKNFFVSLHSTRPHGHWALSVMWVTLHYKILDRNTMSHFMNSNLRQFFFFVVVAACCVQLYLHFVRCHGTCDQKEKKNISFDSIKRVHSIIIWLCFVWRARILINLLLLAFCQSTRQQTTTKTKTYNLNRRRRSLLCYIATMKHQLRCGLLDYFSFISLWI